MENNEKNTTKVLITNGTILLSDTNICIAKIDGIEKDQNLLVTTESNNQNNPPKNSSNSIWFHNQ